MSNPSLSQPPALQTQEMPDALRGNEHQAVNNSANRLPVQHERVVADLVIDIFPDVLSMMLMI
jgi:hypothetical protein